MRFRIKSSHHEPNSKNVFGSVHYPRKCWFQTSFDEDFSGDGTDIQPEADPSAVTKSQRITRLQTLMQMAESPLGQAAGMLAPQCAQAMVQELMDTMDVDRPERFVSEPQPNPMQEQAAQLDMAEKQAKVQVAQATAQEKMGLTQKVEADAVLAKARALREIGLTHMDSEKMFQETEDKIFGQGAGQGQPMMAPPMGGPDANSN